MPSVFGAGVSAGDRLAAAKDSCAGEGRDAVSVECHRRWAFRNDVLRICAGTAAMSVS
ncbi:hypothetical protein I4I89_06350 [Corynebacterium diphtheriae bv. gravis]|uniref:hypothetical protein n=1 Tax=Corynebacterium diphtheriae TaxID=1717 RepID=UPI000A9B86FA|nr:hypothetical protein [Corynebacterium diphtheriae]MBG9352151.1 hypothetical protein [Corynebacterium diphtheriae bv. gravis]